MATATVVSLLVQVGEAGERENISCLGGAADYLNALDVGRPTKWGLLTFDTVNYHDGDCVRICWVDSDGNEWPLNRFEQTMLTQRLVETYL